MKKEIYDLRDTTFVIPVRIDSLERLDNLRTVTGYILSHCDTRIVIAEGCKRNTGILKAVLHPSVEILFQRDDMEIFHRTRYINALVKITDTPYVAVWDADVIVPAVQFDLSVKALRDGKADMVFPYDGRFFDTGEPARNRYFDTTDMAALEESSRSMRLPFGPSACGGGFFVNKQSYGTAGMENENFFGWGVEDGERVKRLQILGLKISRVNGPMYHFSHPRGINSGFRSGDAKMNATKEYLRICDMSKDELQKEVANRHHMKNA